MLFHSGVPSAPRTKPSSVDRLAMINGRDRFRRFSRCDKYDFVDKTVLFRGGANVSCWQHLTDMIDLANESPLLRV